MSYSISSDEVAEDYRRALEDLTMNSRWEISNLTVIAKENTEHALAISEALKDHIKKIAPAKKLPAFYVLDSVVKNVGTPYTLFFGRGLYSTFMEAYALVDSNVRRKMEEMLKTWKEPVPGSIDTRPVFPPDVTRPIESALFKAKTSAIQAQQEHERSQKQLFNRVRPGSAQPQQPYRNTPTPPNAMRQQFAPPSYPPSYIQQYPSAGNQQYGNQQYGQQRYPSPQPAARQQYPPQSSTPSWPQQISEQSSGVSDASLDTLNRDIANLIDSKKAEYSSNTDDSVLQTLRALFDLQTVLSKQKLTPDQFDLIRQRVTALSVPVAPAPIPVPQPAPVVVQPPPAQQPTLSSLLGPGALAALLARQSATPQAQTPPLPAKLPVQSPQTIYTQPAAPPVQVVPAPAPAVSLPDPNSLLEKLRAAGMLPPVTPTPPASTPVPQSALSGTLPPGFPPSLPFLGTPPVLGNIGRPVLAEIPNDVVLNSNSLKIPRPHLISGLYEKLGAPCTQCGRRFQSDADGKAKKTAHMDWHFRVHQRMTEAEKRGQHRSWYVDELDWIKTREADHDHAAHASSNGFSSSQDADTQAVKAPRLQYLAVPDDPVLAAAVCPICQEKFDTKWLDDAQDFVWMDAVEISGRIYHASCHSDARRDGATPERVLGKRKAEEMLTADRTRIKTEIV